MWAPSLLLYLLFLSPLPDIATLSCGCFCILQALQKQQSGNWRGEEMPWPWTSWSHSNIALLSGVLRVFTTLVSWGRWNKSRRGWTSKQFQGPWTMMHFKQKLNTGLQVFLLTLGSNVFWNSEFYQIFIKANQCTYCMLCNISQQDLGQHTVIKHINISAAIHMNIHTEINNDYK